MSGEKLKVAVSVIVPVYNGEKYLKKTLSCLEEQTFSDFELILVDDGSTDRTNQILESFQKRTKIPTTILTQKNKGPGAARNTGLAHAQGSYLALLDADDVYEPELLEKLYRKAISTKAEVTVCRSDELWPEWGRIVETPWTINKRLLPRRKGKTGESDLGAANEFSSKDIPENFFEVFVGWTWDKLFKAEYIKKSGIKFQELRSSDDAFFCFMALLHAKKIAIIDDILVHHTKYLPAGHGTSEVRSVSNSRELSWDNYYKALVAMKKQMLKWSIYDRFERDYINYFLNFSLWHLTTLTGAAYFQLFEKLKTVWFPKNIGKNRPPEFFYSPYHFDLYSRMMQMGPNDFLFFIRQQSELRVSDLEWHNKNLNRDLKLEQRRTKDLEKEIERLSGHISELEKEVINIKTSTAWKVGRAATIIPRKIKSTIKGEEKQR